MKNNKNILVAILTTVTFLFLLFIFYLLEIHYVINLIISVGLASYLWFRFKKNEKAKSPTYLADVSNDRKDHYQSKGLSNEDIQFFRETLHSAKLDILAIEKEFKKDKKLRAIDQRYDLIVTLKTYFKNIVNHPNEIHKVNRFLYVYLPSLKELLQKYNALNNQQRKSTETFTVLQKTRKTIDEICENIISDFDNFNKKISKDLDQTIDEIKPLI